MEERFIYHAELGLPIDKITHIEIDFLKKGIILIWKDNVYGDMINLHWLPQLLVRLKERNLNPKISCYNSGNQWTHGFPSAWIDNFPSIEELEKWAYRHVDDAN